MASVQGIILMDLVWQIWVQETISHSSSRFKIIAGNIKKAQFVWMRVEKVAGYLASLTSIQSLALCRFFPPFWQLSFTVVLSPPLYFSRNEDAYATRSPPVRNPSPHIQPVLHLSVWSLIQRPSIKSGLSPLQAGCFGFVLFPHFVKSFWSSIENSSLLL